MATIGVIVTTKNIQECIYECLSSILEDQSWGDDLQLELIVVDNNSTDKTREIVEKHFLNDSRVSLVNNTVGAGGTSRNMGIELAKGEYLTFVDGDDILPTGTYRKMFESLEKTGSDMVFGDYLHFTNNKSWNQPHLWQGAAEKLNVESRPTLIRSRVVWNKLYRTQFVRDAKVVFPDAPRANDIVAMTTATLAAKSIDVIEDNIYLYRHRPGNGSMTSQAGQMIGYKSYLKQESICMKLVAEHGSTNVWNAYIRFAGKRFFGGTARMGHFYTMKTLKAANKQRIAIRGKAKKSLGLKTK